MLGDADVGPEELVAAGIVPAVEDFPRVIGTQAAIQVVLGFLQILMARAVAHHRDAQAELAAAAKDLPEIVGVPVGSLVGIGVPGADGLQTGKDERLQVALLELLTALHFQGRGLLLGVKLPPGGNHLLCLRRREVLSFHQVVADERGKAFGAEDGLARGVTVRDGGGWRSAQACSSDQETIWIVSAMGTPAEMRGGCIIFGGAGAGKPGTARDRDEASGGGGGGRSHVAFAGPGRGRLVSGREAIWMCRYVS